MKIPVGLKKTAAMVILRHQEEFLLLKRAKMPNQGMYVPVGGKLEPYERPLAAAVRETFEETGIQVNQLKYCGVLVESSPTTYNWQCHIYLADISKVPPPPCDEGELEWIAHDQILNVPTPPTDWFIYKYLTEGRPFAMDADYDDQLNMLELREEIEGVVLWKK